jgi:hypothetical protein
LNRLDLAANRERCPAGQLGSHFADDPAHLGPHAAQIAAADVGVNIEDRLHIVVIAGSHWGCRKPPTKLESVAALC